MFEKGGVAHNTRIHRLAQRPDAFVWAHDDLECFDESLIIQSNEVYANRIKITNLPEVCTIRIYNLQGTLVRQFSKADPLTSVDWDLKNERNVPIAGGVYIIHVDVPGIGDKTLKWFGIMRPTDLDNF